MNLATGQPGSVGGHHVRPGQPPPGHDGGVPLDVELAEIRDALTSVDPGLVELTHRSRVLHLRRGEALADGDDAFVVRSGAVAERDGRLVATSDTLLVALPAGTPEADVAGVVRGCLPGLPASDLRLLAVDVETTGLRRGLDRVVAVGWVPVDGGAVDLAGARRYVVRGDDPGGAAEIHGLTREDLARGTPLADVLGELRTALEGRVLLAHHAPFDLAFLRAAFRESGLRMPRVPVVCTLTLQKRLLRADGPGERPEGALRLWVARDRFGMPPRRPHDALGDALACAELYLGQAAELGAGRQLALRDLRLRIDRLHRTRRWLGRDWWRVRRRLHRAPAGGQRG